MAKGNIADRMYRDHQGSIDRRLEVRLVNWEQSLDKAQELIEKSPNEVCKFSDAFGDIAVGTFRAVFNSDRHVQEYKDIYREKGMSNYTVATINIDGVSDDYFGKREVLENLKKKPHYSLERRYPKT